MVMISLGTSAQVKVKNGSNANISISDPLSKKSVKIPINNLALISFLKNENGTVRARISHSTYKPGKGFIDIDDGEFVLLVNNGVAVFSNAKHGKIVSLARNSKSGKSNVGFSSNSLMTTSSSDIYTVGSDITTQSGNNYIATQSGNNYIATQSGKSYGALPMATFQVKNRCSKTITGNTPPFTGLCLKAEQTGDREYTVPTGNIQACFSFDNDPDSTATGKNRKWAVLDKSVPEGTTLFEITDENLVFSNTGIPVSKKLENTTSRGFLIVNDDFRNGDYQIKTVTPKSTQKIDFFLGWNVMALQFKGDDDLIHQTVIMFLVVEQGGTLRLTEKAENGDSIFRIE